MKVTLQLPYSLDYAVGYVNVNRENRQMIYLVPHGSTKVKNSTAYARYLMAVKLGRYLNKNEHIDHINNDKTDDRIENLQIVTQHQNHIKSSAGHLYLNLNCPTCGSLFAVSFKNSKYRISGMQHNFCCRKCLHTFISATVAPHNYEKLEEEFIFLRFPKNANRGDEFLQYVTDYLKDPSKLKDIKKNTLIKLGVIVK